MRTQPKLKYDANRIEFVAERPCISGKGASKEAFCVMITGPAELASSCTPAKLNGVLSTHFEQRHKRVRRNGQRRCRNGQGRDRQRPKQRAARSHNLSFAN